MSYLIDTSVLIALADVGNEHHQRCDKWLKAWAYAGWATCPIVENGMVRIMSGTSYPGGFFALSTLHEVLLRMKGMRGHFFVCDDVSLVESEFVNFDNIKGHQQITDAYLLGLCRKHGLKLVTTDRRIEPALAPGEGIVELI